MIALPLGTAAAAPAAAQEGCPPVTDRWELVDLGFTGEVADINDSGQIVGTLRGGENDRRAFVWQDGRLTVLSTLGGFLGSSATGIDDEGRITGYSESSADQKIHAVLWENGRLRDLGALGGRAAFPEEIEHGVVVGQVSVDGAPRGKDARAFMWRDGRTTRLGVVPGSRAVAVNGAGQVAGVHRIAAGFPSPYERTDHAFVWQNGVTRDLGTLGGNWSTVSAINDRGQVLGDSALGSDGVHKRAFVWSAETGMEPVREDGGTALPRDINNDGVIVGQYGCDASPYGPAHPAVWADADASPLLLPAPSEWPSYYATDMNDRGEIVGGSHDGVGYPRPALWRPKPAG
ncbi:hypothetical protein [Planomonospora venezuelensis]|uniref:Putative HAF family extracellular repeat protein n=1 Tax=Planomonospora venezuelensis TaxID=1999 RepID=A0A841CTU2_PLAVE|nr:putative HAF family extracellular repeat protein [Planomonospora venezuelensis]